MAQCSCEKCADDEDTSELLGVGDTVGGDQQKTDEPGPRG